MAKSVKQPVETPPYLKQVRIRDYAPLRDAKVDFKSGLNIIIGNNGVGKTKFLTLLNRLANIYQDQIDGIGCELTVAGDYNIKVEYKEMQSDNKPKRPGPYDSEDKEFESRNEVLTKVTYKAETLTKDTIFDAMADLKKGRLFSYEPVLVAHGIPTTGLPLVEEIADMLLEKRSVTITLKGVEKKLIHQVQSRFIQSWLRSVVRVMRNGFTVLNGVAVPALTAEQAKQLITRVTDIYVERLNNYLPLYSPIGAIKRSVGFDIYYNNVQDEYILKGPVLEYKVGEVWLPFSALSDGTKRLFYIIAELISPVVVSVDKQTNDVGIYDGGKVILLEEPELGIHPDQLHKLLSLIREVSREHQVIMTTHSPQVLDMLSEKELDRITICELDPKKGTQFRKLSRAKQEEARTYMREQLHLSDFWRYADLEAKD